VTHNAKDCPRGRVPVEIEIQSPADLAPNTVLINPSAVVRAVPWKRSRPAVDGGGWR